MSIRWIYLDESEFEVGDTTYIAYGALITEKLIIQDDINKALSKLAQFKNNNDVDYRDKQDNRTLSRKYFHACDDACCAHTAICSEIENLNGEFVLNCIPKAERVNLTWLGLLTSLSGQFHTGHSVHVFEEREDLTPQKLNYEYNLFDKDMIQNLANTLFAAHYFPAVCYKITNKQEAGIQFIDFILWSYQRKLRGKSESWFNRVLENSRKKSSGFNIQTHSVSDITPSDFYYSATVNLGLSKDLEYHKEYMNRQGNDYLYIKTTDEINEVNIRRSLLIMNNAICNLKFPMSYKGMLKDQFDALVRDKYNNLELLVCLFLKIFDNCKLIKQCTSEDEVEILFIARKIAALTFSNKYDKALKLQEELKKIWQDLINENLV